MAKAGRETEVKFLVQHLPALAARIAAQGGVTLTPRIHELNLRYDTADNSLRRAGCALRLRRDAAVTLTYKGASAFRAGARSRDEFETTVGDFDMTHSILEGLGFAVVFQYEKFRTTLALGGVEIMLDELPIGDFVEIEGEFGLLRPVADQLKLDWEQAIEDSYHALFEKLRVVAQLPFRDLTFGNFEGRSERAGDLGILPADRQLP